MDRTSPRTPFSTPLSGSARQAADDARQYLENGSGVLLLAGDMRRANILAEMLRKEGVRAAASLYHGAVEAHFWMVLI